MVSSMITRYGRRWRIEDGSGQLEWNNGFLPASSRGWALCGGYGDGSPHARGQRVGMDSSLRLHGGGTCAGGTGMGPRMREDNGWGWILACVFMGVGPVRGVRGWVPACARTTVYNTSEGTTERLGPRIREDNGWGWILACVFAGVGPVREDGDGSPHARGQREGMDSSLRLHGGGTCAGGYGDGSPHARGQREGDGFLPASSWGWALCGNDGCELGG